MGRLISRQQAASLLDVDCQTVTNWINKGILRGRMIDGRQMVDRATITRYFDSLGELSSMESALTNEKSRLDSVRKDADATLADFLSARSLLNVELPQSVFIPVIEAILSVAEEFVSSRSLSILSGLLHGSSLDQLSAQYGISRHRVIVIAVRVCHRLWQMKSYHSLYMSCKEKEAELAHAESILSIQRQKIIELSAKLDSQESAKENLLSKYRSYLGPKGGEITDLLNTSIRDVTLTARSYNCVRAADVETLGDLVRCHPNQLMKFRNFGRKSLREIEDMLAGFNLHFGMDVDSILLADHELMIRHQMEKNSPE